jgi:hypothetical protein
MQSLKEETEIFLKTKEVGIQVKFLLAGVEYNALLDVQDVPDNNSISMSIESTASNGAKGDIRVKVVYNASLSLFG